MSGEMTAMNALHVTTINCPGCGAELQPIDRACQQCGHAMPKPAAIDSKEKLKQLLDRPWVIVVLMLHVGLLGIPVYWKTNYSLGARLLMVIASIVYTIGAVAFIVVMLQRLIRLATGG